MKKTGIAIVDIRHATPDQKLYWSYHEDCTIKGNNLIIKNPKCKIYDKHVVFFKKCTKLTDQMTCGVYGKPERPQICDFGHTTDKVPVIYDTTCIYLPEDQQGHTTVQEWKKRQKGK